MFITNPQRAVLAGVLVAFTATLPAAATPMNNCAQSKCREEDNNDSEDVRLLQLAVNSDMTVDASDAWGMFEPDGPKKSVKQSHPYYHTSAELRAKAEALSKDCGGALKLTTLSDNNTHIDVVNVRKPGSSPVNKVFLLFGEHSRELISPESGFRLLELLCGKAKVEGKEGLVPDVLLDNEFQIVLNGNPGSRSKVEEGDFCLRANPNGIDLNRNWDEKFEADSMSDPTGTSGGSKPFSEAETRIFKKLVSEFKPTTFLTIHSGTKGMYMPYAYDTKHLGSYNAPLMLQILKDLDKDHCQCPFGAAGKEVGYACPGTCLDWVYDKLKTPYVFAFEIYTDDESGLKSRWEKLSAQAKTSLLQSDSHLGHEHFAELFRFFSSDFVQLQSQDLDSMDLDDKLKNMDVATREAAQQWCFNMFNPKTETKYNEVVQNWAVVYLEMAQKVASDIKSKKIKL